MEKTYIVGIYNGLDVDDYYLVATSKEEAKTLAEFMAKDLGGEVYCIIG